MKLKLENISRQLFSIGVVATAVLMPLDLITEGGLAVEWFVLLLLAQRFAVNIVLTRPFYKNFKALFIDALPFVVAGIALVLSSLVSDDRSTAIPYLAVLLSLLGRGWIISRFTSKDDFKAFEKTTLIMCGLIVIFSFYQFFGDILGIPPRFTGMLPQYRSFTAFPFPRVHALALEPLYLANYLLLPLAFLLVRLRKPAPRSDLLTKLLFIATLTIIILSVSRSAILGLVVSGLIYLVVVRKELPYIKRLVVLGCLSLILTIGMVFSVKFLPKIELKARANESLSIFGTHITNLNEGSAQTRYELWPKAISLFTAHPFTGVGLNGSRGALHPEQLARGDNYDQLQPINNDYLTIVAEGGLLGIIGWLPLLIIVIKRIWQTIKLQYRHIGAALAIVLIAVAVQMNSFSAIALLRTWVVIAMFLAAWRLSPKQTSRS